MSPTTRTTLKKTKRFVCVLLNNPREHSETKRQSQMPSKWGYKLNILPYGYPILMKKD